MTEADIIRGCSTNDRRSQKVLYDRYSAVMYAICLRYTHQRDSALDVLQDGFIKVFSKIGDYKGIGSFEGWMKRIFIHTAIDYYHKIKSLTEMFPDIDPGVVNLHESTNVISRMSEKELLLMISEIPHGYRMVFNLYVIEGYDHEEISKMLGISAGTSRSQLVKARKYLQMKLKELKIEAA
jgi:RNA polymerase sigma-70 factor (ECF subfamily)